MDLTTYKLYALGEHFNVYMPMVEKEEGFQPKTQQKRPKRELEEGRHLGTAHRSRIKSPMAVSRRSKKSIAGARAHDFLSLQHFPSTCAAALLACLVLSIQKSSVYATRRLDMVATKRPTCHNIIEFYRPTFTESKSCSKAFGINYWEIPSWKWCPFSRIMIKAVFGCKDFEIYFLH